MENNKEMNNKEMNNKRDSFGSKIGIIAAAAGSAIGLGNIYRFPFIVGDNGGAAFIIIYLLIIICLGIPIALSEFVIGRRSQKNLVGAFKELAPGSHWNLVGYIGVICAVFIFAFYSTVAGWTLEYIIKAANNFFSNKDIATIEQGFIDFQNAGARPVIWQVIFIILTAFVILGGIKDGIEKYTKILMPALFIILIILCIKSLALSNSSEGLKFLFKPDFSKIDSKVILNALGQAFFSLSVGMGCLITYGSYINKKDNLTTTTLSICLADTLVAILAGIIIFPAAFSFGVPTEAGFGLAFNTLPLIFNQMTGGYFFCLIFFILLAIAALTSTISLLEVIVTFLTEEFNIKRKSAIILGSSISAILGIFATLSLRNDSIFTINGKPLFDNLDFLTANILLPLGALLVVIFVAWKMKKDVFYSEITNENTIRLRIKNLIFFIIKFIAPIVIILIFINQLFLS